jgi:hypothetical protein
LISSSDKSRRRADRPVPVEDEKSIAPDHEGLAALLMRYTARIFATDTTKSG